MAKATGTELMAQEMNVLRELWTRTKGVIMQPLRKEDMHSDERRHAQIIHGIRHADMMHWAETPTGKGVGEVIEPAYGDAFRRLKDEWGYIEVVPDSPQHEERLQVTEKARKICTRWFGTPWTEQPQPVMQIVTEPKQARDVNTSMVKQMPAPRKVGRPKGSTKAVRTAKPGSTVTRTEVETHAETEELTQAPFPASYTKST